MTPGPDTPTDHDLLREVHHDVRYIRETIEDHEERIRRLEAEQRLAAGATRAAARIAGVVSAVVALLLAGVQVAVSVLMGGGT